MKSTLLLSSVCLGALITSPAAWAQLSGAQSSEPQVNGATNAQQDDGLADIVITAQRRSENLQHAAIAVSAVTGDSLRDSGVTRPADLTSVVPALQVSSSSGSSSVFYLRGVGNFNANALSDPAVAFNFNGVYIGRTTGTTGYFYDLERVEVLKGPQGTLYGRNATGGAVNVIPHRAELGETSGELTVEYGNYDAVRVDGDLNMPLGKDAAVRAAGIYVRHNGYMNDGTDDQNDMGGRVSLRVEPMDSLTINLTGDVFRQRGNGTGATPMNLNVDDRIGLLSPQGQAFYASQPNVLLGRTFAPITADPYMHNNSWGVSSNIEWQSDWGKLTLIPAYRENHVDFVSDNPGFVITQKEKDKQTSVEARFATDDTQPLRFLIGGFYYDETNDAPLNQYNSQSQLSNQTFSQSSESLAAFGRVTYAPVPDVRLTVGGRYTTEDKTFTGTNNSVLRPCVIPTTYNPTYVPGCPTASTIPYNTLTLPAADFDPRQDGTLTVPSVIDDTGVTAKKATFNKFTYRLGADWDVTDSNLLFASYETGFKSGGFFFSADAGTYRPETIEAYTLGSKNRFFDNRLQINIEAFYWQYKNQQISHVGYDSKGTIIFATENVGQSTIKGFETEIQYLPIKDTLLSADVQYLDGRYDNFIYTTPNSNGGVYNGTGCPSASITGNSYVVNCSGSRPPNSPLWTLNLAAQQTFPLDNGARIIANARAHFQTQTLTGLEFTAVEKQDAYWMADASLTYNASDDRFFVTAFVNNIFDKTVVSATFPTSFALFTVGTLRPPRTYGLRTGVRF
ncbi:TonB-dependent receptor [Nitrospirillum sp. BR 11828]|uniref:TonB-dependent receptor n=1 Tax=Nitrospirillum sp. BR 11828 TaxID=3104325 RepID=UPI002ACB04F5|nr:TonB-dependent receptor [Nitrospirillum sp. BR 11828]MDZ5646010.1 TonB-dependent receptor [Nitrospirillum sp. BR 11828]